MEIRTFDRARKLHAAYECCRKSERAIVYPAIRNCAIEVSAERDGRGHIELPASNADCVAVFVITIDAAPYVKTRQAETVARAFSDPTCSANSLTEEREATAVETELEM